VSRKGAPPFCIPVFSSALPAHLDFGRGRVSSTAASSLTRIEPRAQTTTARASLSLREHAAYEDTLPLLLRSWAIAKRFCDVRRCDFSYVFEVGNRSCDFQDTMIAARGQA
jgi:hypothetical protein